LEEVGLALGLLARYDSRRLEHIRFDVRRILVYSWPAELKTLGLYTPSLRLCHLNAAIFDNNVTGRTVIGACVIVHEAMHARLQTLGVRPSSHDECTRIRIERICTKAEMIFASRLPKSDALRAALAEHVVTLSQHCSDQAVATRRVRGLRIVARTLGIRKD
jgi:hypothetical protein